MKFFFAMALALGVIAGQTALAATAPLEIRISKSSGLRFVGSLWVDDFNADGFITHGEIVQTSVQVGIWGEGSPSDWATTDVTVYGMKLALFATTILPPNYLWFSYVHQPYPECHAYGACAPEDYPDECDDRCIEGTAGLWGPSVRWTVHGPYGAAPDVQVVPAPPAALLLIGAAALLLRVGRKSAPA